MIDQLAKELFNNLQQQGERLRDAKALGESQLRSMLEATVRKLDLVSREEFDTQHVILMRTREKVDALEKEVATLSAEVEALKLNAQK